LDGSGCPRDVGFVVLSLKKRASQPECAARWLQPSGISL